MKILQENGFSRVVRHGRGGAEGRRARRREERPREHLHRQEHHARRAGHHGPRRLVPREADDRVRHEGRRRRHARARAARSSRARCPIFNTVPTRSQATGANTSVIYVPPMFAADAIMEAADAGIKLIVSITEGVPVLDMTRVYPFVKEKGARLLGPNCPGLITPGESQGRHHPGPHLHAGQRRRREPLRHAHVRGRLPAHARRHRPDAPASASAAIRSTAPTSSTASRRSRPIRRRRRSR